MTSDQQVRLEEEAVSRTLKGTSFTEESLAEFLYEKRMENAVERGLHPSKQKMPSKSTIKTVQKSAVPLQFKKNSRQKLRRIESANDLLNHASGIGVFAAALGICDNDGPPINPSLLFKTYKVCVFLKENSLNGKAQIAFTVKRAVDVLRQQKRNVSVSSDQRTESQARCIYALPTVSADGKELCTVYIIKDNNFSDMKLLCLKPKRYLLLAPAEGTDDTQNFIVAFGIIFLLVH